MIPFNKPTLVGKELQYLTEAIHQGSFCGNGPFTKRCQALLEQALGVSRILLTTSCTDALEMAALLLDVRDGDEVIVPSFTFVSTPNAFVLHGATPVFADIRRDTLNIDEAQLPRLMTSRTKAIVPVHYGGVACEMDAILEVASRHGVAVVEDNAHGPFGTYKGAPLGTIGGLGALSFHDTKNFTCGEGGALLVNDPEYAGRAEIVWEKGTNRSSFLRGEVGKYTWMDVGSSHLPSDLLAAFLYAQLEARVEIQSRRRTLWVRYQDGLAEWASEHEIALPVVPSYCEPAYHLFFLLLPTAEARRDLAAHLKKKGIQSAVHYPPLHLSALGRRFGGADGDCPVTESVSERLLRLPFSTGMTDAEQDMVIREVNAFALRQAEVNRG
jgi:dTDP-4-amino-4,6-dideoxygalactose transaminase